MLPSRLWPATVQLSEQLARQSDPIAVIDALNRIAQSRDLGGVLGARRLPPKKDDQEKRLGRLSPGWERLLAWRRATSPMRTQSRAARGVLLRAEPV